MGEAIQVITLILFSLLLLWWTASALTRVDLTRQKTADELRAALERQHEREQQFLAVLYASPDAMQLIADNHYIDCNPATLQMLGYSSKAEFLLANPSGISPPLQPDGRDSAEKALAMMALALQQGFHRFNWIHRRANGEEFPADVCLTAIVVSGQTQLHCVVHDVTEAARREQTLRQLSRAVEQTSAAVVITDTRGAIEYVNPAFTRLTGYAAAEALGKNPSMLQSGLTSRDTYRQMWTALRAGSEWRGELCNRSKSGTFFWELAVISPLRDAHGRTTHYVGVKEDITARKALDKELQLSRLTLARAMDLAQLAHWEYEFAGDTFTLNDRLYALCGTTAQREGGYKMASRDYIRNFVHPDDAPLISDAIQRTISSNLPHYEAQIEHRIIRRDGAVRCMLARYATLRGPDGTLIGAEGATQDITEIKRTEADLRAKTALFEAQVNASIDALLVVDDNNRRIITNRRMGELFNVPWEIKQDVDDTALLRHVMGLVKDPDAFLKRVQHLNSNHVESSRDELELQSGTFIDRYSAPVIGADGHYYGRIWSFRDITPQKNMEAELRAAAHLDRLTGLPNRTLLCDRLQQAVLRSQRMKDYHFAVLFLDMDRFKLINDSLGHDVGDLMLKEIARRLNSVVRIGDSLTRPSIQNTTARMGGDEFVILLDGLAQTDHASLVAQRLLEILAQPYRLGEHDIYSTASIGIVTSNLAAENAEQILRDADTAMYEAKLNGKGRLALFGAPMRQRVQNRLNTETDLRKAIDSEQFFLLYEPIVSLTTGQIERFEALLRWQHPTRGLIMPGEFIAIAEETGMIIPMGEWVLRQACRQFARWRADLGNAAPRSISVNLSRTQLLLSDLPDRVRAILRETSMPPERLHLEITENAVMRDVAGAVRTLHAIKELGVKLDIDDFGTGYSSLACLHQFPMDVLKIDRSFIANIERGRDFSSLIHAVSQLACNLKFQIVGEGIETADQALILQTLECEYGQGYLFSKPMPADKVPAFKVDPTLWARHTPIDAPLAATARPS